MSEYEVGYKKPPQHTRFKKGICPNPKGRGAKKSLKAGEIYENIITAPVKLTEGGKTKDIPRWEYTIKLWAKKSAMGDIQAAELLLTVYHYSKTYGDYRHVPIEIEEWERADVMEIHPSMSPTQAAAAYDRLLREISDTWPNSPAPIRVRKKRKRQR
jgi:hypothetical protein